MNSPVTIVIPAYNRASVIRRTLDSVASQKERPARVVLVDNNSTDGTMGVMRQWAAANPQLDVVVVQEMKPGACAARNRGLREVESEFVMFFDSDDVMLPSHVGDFESAIALHPEIDIFGRNIYLQDIDGSRRKLYYTSHAPMFNHLFRGCLSTQRMVVRTSLVLSVGGWNEALPGWNDYELGVRLLLATDRLYELPGEPSVVTYRLENSITGTSYSARPRNWKLSLDAIEKHLRDAGRTDIVALIDARRMILAAQYRLEAEGKAEESARRNAVKQSSRLNNEVTSRTAFPLRMRLIYLHNRYFKRLTWVVVKMLFPKI